MQNGNKLSKTRWTSKVPTRAGIYEWRGAYTAGTFSAAVSFKGEPTVLFTDGEQYPLSEIGGEWRKTSPS